MKKLAFIVSTLIIILTIVGVAWYANSQGIALLNPQGVIANYQNNLLVFAALLSLFVLIPTFIIAGVAVYRYRIGHPDSDLPLTEAQRQVRPEVSILWLSLVLSVIGLLAFVLINSTHAIDPYQPLQSSTPPLRVQVVALQWKWLFIYPEHGVATVNQLIIPQKTPINFEITADAPVSAFWIPQLGGMIYAMEGMVTKLHLMADTTGEFSGNNAEINGKGYADMKFTTRSVTNQEFSQWIIEAKESNQVLTQATYQQLAQPTIKHPVEVYAATEAGLYGNILAKFMQPHSPDSNHSTPSHSQQSEHQTH